MRLKPVIPALIIFLIAVPFLQSQTPTTPPEPEIKIAAQPYTPTDSNAIRIKTTMVDVTVVVRDDKGHPMAGLTKDDFQIFDEGKQQKISLFTPELAHPPVVKVVAPVATADAPPIPPPPTPPRYLGFISTIKICRPVNWSMSEKLRKNLSAIIWKKPIAPEFLLLPQQSPSNSPATNNSCLTLCPNCSRIRADLRLPAARSSALPYQAYNIQHMFNEHSEEMTQAINEALGCRACDPKDIPGCVRLVQNKAATVVSLEENFSEDSLGVLGDVIRYMEKMPGRRTMIMASAGFFSITNSVQHAQDKMIDGAIHAGIIINTLDAKGLWAPGDMSQGEDMMAHMNGMLGTLENDTSDDPLASIAYGTGGKFFHNSNDLDGGLRDIAALPEASYVLGFSPVEVKDNGMYHKLKIKLPNHQDINISARPGYFALKPKSREALPATKFQKLNREVTVLRHPLRNPNRSHHQLRHTRDRRARAKSRRSRTRPKSLLQENK